MCILDVSSVLFLYTCSLLLTFLDSEKVYMGKITRPEKTREISNLAVENIMTEYMITFNDQTFKLMVMVKNAIQMCYIGSKLSAKFRF